MAHRFSRLHHKSKFSTAALILCLALLPACTSDVSPEPPPPAASTPPAVSVVKKTPSALQIALEQTDRCVQLPALGSLSSGTPNMLDRPEVLKELRAILAGRSAHVVSASSHFNTKLSLQLYSGRELLGTVKIAGTGLISFHDGEYYDFDPETVNKLHDLLEQQIQWEESLAQDLTATIETTQELHYCPAPSDNPEEILTTSDPDVISRLQSILLPSDGFMIGAVDGNGAWATEWLERSIGDNWERYYDLKTARTIIAENSAGTVYRLTLFPSYYPSGTPMVALTDENGHVQHLLYTLPADVIPELDRLFGL